MVPRSSLHISAYMVSHHSTHQQVAVTGKETVKCTEDRRREVKIQNKYHMFKKTNV